MIEITVRDFIANIRKNGLPQGFGDLFISTKYDDEWDPDIISHRFVSDGVREYLTDNPNQLETIESACAYGQGLINTGAKYTYSESNSLMNLLYATTWRYNDDQKWTIAQIADELERAFYTELDTILEFEEFDYSPWLKETSNV